MRRLLGCSLVVLGIVAPHGRVRAVDCEDAAPGAFGVESRAEISLGNHGRSVAADLDSDGLLDLVLPTDEGALQYLQGRVLVLLNQGRGEFSEPVSYVVGARSTDVVVADFSGDGSLDIVANSRPGLVALVNAGDGTFSSSDFAEDVFASPLGSGDFDGDGTPDLVALTGRNFRFYLTRADATFEKVTDVPLETYAYGLAIADYDGNGLADTASVGHLIDDLYLLLNQGGGRFLTETIPTGPVPIHLAPADVDGDGAVDLAVSKGGPEESSGVSPSDGHISVLRNLGGGNFAPPEDFPTTPIQGFPAERYTPHWITAGDLDGDGDSDLVTANAFTNNVVAAINDAGSFPEAEAFNVGFGPWYATLADLDGDRDLDTLVVKDAFFQGRVAVLWNSSVMNCETASFRRGDCNDDGAVDISDAQCILDWQFAGTVVPSCTAAANANGDRDVDMTDALWLLNFLFRGGPPPQQPFEACGPGTDADNRLGCVASNCP